jgi:hypothetical protein
MPRQWRRFHENFFYHSGSMPTGDKTVQIATSACNQSRTVKPTAIRYDGSRVVLPRKNGSAKDEARGTTFSFVGMLIYIAEMDERLIRVSRSTRIFSLLSVPC